MSLPYVFVSLLILLIQFSNTFKFESVSLHRNKRQLLFPNSTLLQFNAGVGTPSTAKSINVNWAFQANFQLPWNRSQIPIDILEANSGYVGLSRKKRDINTREIYKERKRQGDYESDSRLHYFYKFVEDILYGFGYNGTSCILQTLCQLGAEPLHSDDEEDLIHEIANYVLNPTNDIAQENLKESSPYIDAYREGQHGKPCLKIYTECSTSLVDLFTKLHDA